MNILRDFSVSGALLLAVSLQAQTGSSAPLSIQGVTVDAGGHPVPGVQVRQYGYRQSPGTRFELQLGEEATSDANGQFELKLSRASVLPQAPGFLVARKTGLAAAWTQFVAVAGSQPKLVLTPSSFLAGQVVDETDKPVPNAEVSVLMAYSETPGDNAGRSFSYLSDRAARDLFLTKTGADGKFRIEGFPTNGSAALVAEAPGKVIRSVGQSNFNPDSMPCRSGQDDIRLVLEPGGSIEGKIVGEPGTQLPIAQLNLTPNGPGVFWAPRSPQQSAADGSFRLDSLPAGAYSIQASFGTNAFPEWVAEPVSVTIDTGKVTGGVTVTATRGGLLEVAVRGSTNSQPVEGAAIGAYKAGYQAAGVTGTNGIALLRLPLGNYQVNAMKAGWQQANASGVAESGNTNRVEIELAPARKFQGIVRLPDGKAGAGLPVQVIGDFALQQAGLKTDADGKFEFERNSQQFGNNNGTPCVLVRDPDRNLAVVEDLDDDKPKLELQLAAAVSFVAHVECDGKPVTNATAGLLFRTGNMGMFLNGMTGRTNTPGQVEVVALPPGRQYGLQVSASGYGTKYIELGQQADEAKRVELDPVELKRADRKLAGQLVDSDDKPVAGAMVQTNGDGQPNSVQRTDRDGRFSFDVCEGGVQLFANSQQNFANMTAEAGDTNVVMKLGERFANFGGGAKPQKLKGTVTDGPGKPVVGAEVRVFPMDMQRSTKTDTNGAFNLSYVVQPWQRQNGVTPLVIVRDRAHNLAAAQELTDESTNVTLQVEAGWIVRGQVVGPDNKPLANAQVSLILQTSRMGGQVDDQPVNADAQGRFTFSALPTGQDYRLFASFPGYSQKSQKIEVEWDTNIVELPPIVLRIADQTISGRVIDAKDKPVSGIYVQISSDDQPQSNMQTDSKGRFKFKVCEGQVHIFASGQTGFAQATAQSGDTNVVILLTDRSTRMASNTRRTASLARPNASVLKGKPLPDLATIGFAVDAVPAGKPVLLCLLDVQQRPSRRTARLLAEQQDAIREKGVSVIATQTVPASKEAWDDWKEAYKVRFPVSRLADKSETNKWATGLETLPWLILVDKNGGVVDEGFSMEELDAKLDTLNK
jgi:uncharacterized GH25 family protein